jgi:hypothetical protein
MNIAEVYSKALEKVKPHLGKFRILDPTSVIMKWVDKNPQEAERVATEIYAILQEYFKKPQED